ncbi:MAG: carbon-nitrogen hydrolase family protein, partial [Planctomycetaceae bacterium]|nr:carbon-nitrogen hydrolase family protein [Planctomycetaceae bacterium]
MSFARWIGCCVQAQVLVVAASCVCASEPSVGWRDWDWQTATPREEIRPEFLRTATGGRSGQGALTIQADDRVGLHGYWTVTRPVDGGEWYRFSVWRKIEQIETPRRSVVARVIWENSDGQLVNNEHTVTSFALGGNKPVNRAEHPLDREVDAAGWVQVTDTYRVPSGATQAVIELHLMWAPGGRVEWSDIELTRTSPPSPRTVRLATVHYQPRDGETNAEKCALFEPFIAEAARQRADLVVLPETLTYYGSGRKPEEVAEPMPGPSTEYFGSLARKHDLYIVAGLYERDDHVVYNVATLVGPDGQLVGKYRKVCLPRDEIMSGVTPGQEYPVF